MVTDISSALDDARLLNLPQGWTQIKFIDSIEKISLTDKKLKQSAYLEKGDIPVVDQGQTLIGGYTNRADLKITSIAPIIIFGDHTKVLKFVNFNFVAGAEGVKPFHAQPWYDPKFLFYMLHVVDLPDKGYARHFQYLERVVLPLPPLPEQHRIVTKIEELFTQLNAGVVSLKKVQVQLKRYRQAVLKAAFDGRLTQEWREEHKREIEPASVLFEKIKREYHRDEKEITKRLPLVEAELFQVPEEWIWVRAQDVCENITNGYTPTADKLFEGSGEIPFIKVYNLTKTGSLNFTVKPTFISRITHETELRRSAVYPQDVLMNIVGPPLGKVSLVPELHGEWNINQAMVIYRTFPQYSRKLILYVLLSETIQKWLQKRGKTTAGQTNYTITMSRSLPIPLPPLDEQSIIVNEIERHFSQIDHLEKTLENSLRQAETLRHSILKRAFEGKLVPQDPTDEPAFVLLERIKAERAHHMAEVKKGKKDQSPPPKRRIKHAN